MSTRIGSLLPLPSTVTTTHYPDDKYFPSYVILARHGSDAFHALFAPDVEGDNVRVVTS